VEEEKKAKQAEAAAKREANIAQREEQRSAQAAADAKKPKAASSKYSQREIKDLKKVFDEYDKDRSGKISLAEFTDSLKKKKADSAPRAGQKSTLAQRKAQEGISIFDLSEGVFHELDIDGDGEVTFLEILKLMYGKFATKEEMETMMGWVADAPEPEPEPEPELSDEAKKQINSIFKLYDKDKSGTLTIKELTMALEKTGIEKDEIKGYFKDFDQDGNESIDKEEFMKLMKSTGAFDD